MVVCKSRLEKTVQEESVREKYLRLINSFENGEDVSILKVFWTAFIYYFSAPRNYFKTFVNERIKK